MLLNELKKLYVHVIKARTWREIFLGLTLTKFLLFFPRTRRGEEEEEIRVVWERVEGKKRVES